MLIIKLKYSKWFLSRYCLKNKNKSNKYKMLNHFQFVDYMGVKYEKIT